MKYLAIAAVCIALLCTGAAAAPKQVADFSRLRCEDPKIAEFIRTSLVGMKTESGHPISSYLGNNNNLKAVTISAQKAKLSCHVSVGYLINGSPMTMRGRLTIALIPDGRVKIAFDPGY
jgi:hypothetical protein